MAVLTKWFTMDGKEGVDLNNVQSSVDVVTAPEVPATRANLGDRVQGNNGSEWMFVRAGVTVSAFNILAIGPAFSAQNLTGALIVSNAYSYGIAEFQPQNGVTVGNANGGVANIGDYFWALVKAASGVKINTSGTVAPGSLLYLSGTAGQIGATATNVAGGGRLNGLMFVGSASIDGATLSAEFGQFAYIMPAANTFAVTV